MHVIESYFECGGFDHRFVQGGTSVYLWNLSRSIARAGHTVSIVTPAHGRQDDLRAIGAVELDHVDRYRLPLTLDNRTWHGFPERVELPLETRAWKLSLEGVDLYFLSDALLDQLPDSFYPAYETKGTDLVFFKGIGHQVASVRFIRSFLLGERSAATDTADEPVVLHAHEPFYHYLMPPAFAADPRVRVVSTVQSNMPIGKSEHAPLVRGLLDLLQVPVELPPPDPNPDADLVPMIQYQQRTHLHYAYPPDHVRIYDLVALFSDRISFLSEGHLRFYESFAGTPFEQLFAELPVAGTVRETADRRFVGGCAIGDSWLVPDGPAVDRTAVLEELGLDPRLPTFFHNARYAVHHKGQVELMRAVGRVLDTGAEANFVLRMLTDTEIEHPVFDDVLSRHRERVHLETQRVTDERIRRYAMSAEFCLFPSKFEMDTFLIAMGEAMACGAVPIATAQEGMAHFGHVADPSADPENATGFAVPRSFREDDDLLVTALTDAALRALALHRDQPRLYAQLSRNAVRRARRFSWSRCAAAHLAVFSDVIADRPPVRPRTDPPVREFSAGGDAVCADVPVTVDGDVLHCRVPDLQRAELVLPGRPADLRADALVLDLARHGDGWTVQLPTGAPQRLHLLLTLNGGDTRWVVVQRV